MNRVCLFSGLLLAVAACSSTSSLNRHQPVTYLGVGPVIIGMSLDALTRVPRMPVSVEPRALARCGYAQPTHLLSGVSFMLEAGTVARIDITNPVFRTEAGIHVGSTEAAVYRSYGTAQVVAANHEYVPGGHYLTITSPDGRSAFCFETDGTLVTLMRVGRFPHVTYSEGCE